MSDIYIYDAFETDFTTIGMCGALIPIECTFSEIANGDSNLHLVHPRDDLKRYTCLKENAILKVLVPVRNVTEIQNGQFVNHVTEYVVKGGYSKNERSIWNKANSSDKKNKILATPNAGDKVIITAIPNNNNRWNCCFSFQTWTGKKKKRRLVWSTVNGFIDSKVLDERSAVNTNISQDADGINKVLSPWTIKEQLFRIYSVNKTLKEVTVDAKHISYDLMYNITKYDNPYSVDLQEVCNGILNNCVADVDCEILTNIRGNKSGHHWDNKDPITALFDPEKGEVARYGGQIVRDNNKIYILDTVGIDRGMTFEYGKNITGIDMTLDYSNTCTGVRPQGNDKYGNRLYLTNSLQLNADYSGYTVLSDRNGVIYSPKHELYPFERIYAFEGDDCTAKDEKGTANDITDNDVRTRLLDQGIAYLKNGADEPSISVSIDIVALGSTMQYEEYAGLGQVYLFDTVTAIVPHMDIYTKVAVNQIEWNCLEDELQSVTLGDVIDLSPTTASWQIQSVNGAKIVQGSIGSAQLTDNAVSARTIQADSIYGESIQAEAVTADKINANSLTTNTAEANIFKAAIAEITRGIFNTLQVKNLTVTETLEAAIGKFLDLHAVDLNVSGTGNIAHLVSSVFDLADGNVTGNILIKNLTVEQAQIMNATLMNTVMLGDDGRYYKIHVDGNGLHLEDVTREITDKNGNLVLNANGNAVTADGVENKVILDQLAVRDLSVTGKLNSVFAIISYLYSTLIDTDQLFAREAFIQSLRTMKIVGDKTLQMMTEDTARALAASTATIGTRNYIRNSASLSDAYVRGN